MAVALHRPDRSPQRRSAAPPARRPAQRPALVVVPGSRRVARFAVLMSVFAGAVMIGVLMFHTRIAERQLQIDQFERSVRTAQSEFDILRAERAELRSPTRLAAEARRLGMEPGSESTFLDVDPMAYAIVIASTGEVPVAEVIGAGANTRLEPLDQFRLVKAASAEVP